VLYSVIMRNGVNYARDLDEERAEPRVVADYVVRLFPYSTAMVIAIIAIMKNDHATSLITMGIDYLGLRDVIQSVSIYQWIAIIFLGCFVLSFIVYVWSSLAARRAAALRAATISASERSALMRLYDSTGGFENKWIDRTRWGTNEPLGKWRGVHIDVKTGRVCKLILPSNGLTGNYTTIITRQCCRQSRILLHYTLQYTTLQYSTVT
jgi:hypothetical protein